MGYIYSKMLIYILDERKSLDEDSMANNKKLLKLIKLKIEYKIPLLIILTHCDNYCYEIKKADKNWKNIFKNNILKNKKNLIEYINNLIIKKYKSNNIIKENEIVHAILVEPKQRSDEEILFKLPKKLKDKYDKANEQEKMNMLEFVKCGLDINKNEVRDFFEQEKLGILHQKELIEKIKENLSSQYHSALNEIK